MNKNNSNTARIVLKNGLGTQILHTFKYVTVREFNEFSHRFLAQLAPMYFGTNYKIPDDGRFLIEALSANNNNKIVVER